MGFPLGNTHGVSMPDGASQTSKTLPTPPTSHIFLSPCYVHRDGRNPASFLWRIHINISQPLTTTPSQSAASSTFANARSEEHTSQRNRATSSSVSCAVSRGRERSGASTAARKDPL